MKVNFILIDYENVQALQLEKLQRLPVQIRVFLGPQQCKVPVELASRLQPYGKAGEYILLSTGGKNALDFHIVFYLGKLSSENPGAFFHILSKDSGFDPLIEHLRKLKIPCHRWETVDDIPIVKAAILSPKERIAAAKALLTNPKTAKPATMSKLRNMLKTHFKGVLSEEEMDQLVAALEAEKVWTNAGGKLTFPSV